MLKKKLSGNGKCSKGNGELKKLRQLTADLNGGVELSEEEVQLRKPEIFERLKKLTLELSQ